MGEVIDLHGRSGLDDVLDELMEANRQNLVTDLILTYRRDYTADEIASGEAGGNAGKMCRYWFGESSSIFCLGLWSNMRHIIERYINGEDLIDGE